MKLCGEAGSETGEHCHVLPRSPFKKGLVATAAGTEPHRQPLASALPGLLQMQKDHTPCLELPTSSDGPTILAQLRMTMKNTEIGPSKK